MKITGELLKAERLKRDLTVQDVAYALKLNSKTITAIENGDLDQLPAKTFIRGFVKSYADYLKINTENVLKQFQEEMGSTRPIPKRPPPVATDQVTSQKVEAKSPEPVFVESKFGRNHLIAIATVIVLISLIAVVNNKINEYKNETIAALQNPPVQLQSETGIIDPSIEQTQPAATESLNSNPSGATGAPANETTAGAPPATATAPSASASGVPTETSSTSTPTSPTGGPAKPVNSVQYPNASPSPGKPIELLIEAKKEIVIEYAKGNSTQFTTLRMAPQTFQIIRSQTGLHLRTPDGSAIQLTVNGVLKGSAANTATPTVLSF